MEAAQAMATCGDLLHDATATLQRAGIDTARLDAEVLLAEALGCDRAGLYTRMRAVPDAAEAARFAASTARRARREPIAYILERQEFWSLPFSVSPAVLIPRPETELLVEIACRIVRGGDARATICDVGTGSGCIAIALAVELPQASIIALDASPAALAVAARNAARHCVADRVALRQSDLFAALPTQPGCDLIVSNPPYCRPSDAFAPEVAFEPASALLAGADGLDVIGRLLAEAPAYLRPDGWLAIEFGAGQAAAMYTEAERRGWQSITIEPDLAGIPRVLVARHP